VVVVHEWLISAGVAAEKISQSFNKQWMQFDASAAFDIESLLNTEYHVYEDSRIGKFTVACDKQICLLMLALLDSDYILGIMFFPTFRSTSGTLLQESRYSHLRKPPHQILISRSVSSALTMDKGKWTLSALFFMTLA
jgi:hypothetical protein